jgi:hypothetical protein
MSRLYRFEWPSDCGERSGLRLTFVERDDEGAELAARRFQARLIEDGYDYSVGHVRWSRAVHRYDEREGRPPAR